MSKHRTRTTWRNRLLSGVLCLALVLGLLPTVGLVQTAEAAHWADPYGEQLVEWGIMNPSSDLRLDATITRAEFVAMCNRAFGYKRLGGTPFVDVPSYEWYAQDIDIAYNAGYFNGTSSDPARPMASPNGTLTREQAATLLVRNMMLQETVGESQGFTDSRDLSEWSRGLIGAAVAEGMINGLPGGSFGPFNNITRGEVAAMLVRAIGNPIRAEGNYELGGVYGNVTISSSNVTLRNTVVLGNLYITGGVDLGNVLLENVTVLGRIVISGGGVSNAAQSSVLLRNVEADELVVDSLVNQFVTISTYGLTDIPLTSVRSDSYLEDSSAAGYGLHKIELAGKSGTQLQLAGSIKEVVNKTPRSLLQLVKGTAETITIDEYATGSELLVDINTRVDELNLDVATRVYGKGDIIDLNIAANGCEVEILPEHVEVRPGITATVDDKVIGSADASEMSSEPRILSGYPAVSGLTPKQAEGLYAGNKPGTIYWAVSEIAEGSVSVEDLLNNPAYGGNIFKDGEKYQSGSIDASARTEYGRLISGLEPDGSYYISAVLVDGRGNRSPLKVISFTTPDDTVPAFADGYPHMTKTTCDTAQVTAMANKSCQLYWVLLPAGANAPTVQNFKSGSFGGSYGYGSQSVVKNVPVSIKVNSTRLQENTDYDLYLWLNDFNGAMCSDVIKVLNETTQRPADPSFRTPDETPPVVTSIMQTNFNLTDAIEFSFNINEAPSTLHWAVVAESDEGFIKPGEDMNSLSVQYRVVYGTGAIVRNSKAAAGADVSTKVEARDFANALKYSEYLTHNFKLYYVAEDAAGNYSEVKYIVIHTQDNEPPTVTQKFSSAIYDTDADKAAGRKPQPKADSNIMLVFSEQVKGEESVDAPTFVDFYNEVKTYKDLIEKNGDTNPTTKTLLDAARKNLADELSKHITLYYVQKNSGGRTTPVDSDKNNVYGWIDWSYATVELQKNGTVVLTLPVGEAVSLGGGMEYYFHLENIFDDSNNTNPLVIRDENGRIIDGGEFDYDCDLEHFTTVYAQVQLYEDDTGISKIEGKGEGGKDIDLDMVVNVTPRSTSKTTATDSWDMVIWSELAVQFNVYRRVRTGNNWTEWELAAEGMTIFGASTNSSDSGSDLTAASLNNYKTDGYINGSDFAGTEGAYKHDKYDTVVGGLQENHTYQYGISFTSVGGGAGASDRKSWTSLVQMRFSLVAGAPGNVQNLSDSGNVNSSYTDLVYTRALLSEIGAVDLGNTTGTILEVEKRFRDERPPEFTSTAPTLTAGTGTISIEVALNRHGTVYYVVAPAGMIPTYIEDGVEITADIDGSLFDDGKLTEDEEGLDKTEWLKNHTNGKSYIPLSGAERASTASTTGTEDEEEEKAALSDYIHFAGSGENRGKYYSPTYSEIYSGAFKGDLIRTGSIVYEGVRKPIRIAEGLEPGRWYYVYIILQSTSGNLDQVVQIYRVKTKDVEPPVIVIAPSGAPTSGTTGGTTSSSTTGVSMKINDRSGDLYDSPVLYYALAQMGEMPDWFNDKYTWKEGGAEKIEDEKEEDKKEEEDKEEEDKEEEEDKKEGGPESRAAASDGEEMSILEALIKQVSGGGSYFDKYATEELKKQVMEYITISTSDAQWGNKTHYYDKVGPDKLAGNNPWIQNCKSELTLEGEYVMLVCARNSYKNENEGENYGFAAARGLYKPDDVPPELNYPVVGTDGTGIEEAIITAYWTGTRYVSGSLNELGTDPMGYIYSGELRLSFSKAIYWYDGNNLKQIVAPNDKGEVENPNTEISIWKVIGASSTFTKVTANANNSAFTFVFTGISNGQGFTMTNIFNSSGSEAGKSQKTLVVRFGKQYRHILEGYETPVSEKMYEVVPYFNITWK